MRYNVMGYSIMYIMLHMHACVSYALEIALEIAPPCRGSVACAVQL